MSNTVEVDKLKAGVAAMSTRPFGERFCECLLAKRYGLQRNPNGTHHDLRNPKAKKTKIEAKFSRIFAPVQGNLLLDYIANCARKKLGSVNHPFKANFQKLHPSQFNVLYYGLVCDEGVMVYMATRKQLQPKFKNQHVGNKKMKQFNVDNSTLEQHKAYFVEVLPWPDIWELLSGAERAAKRGA